MLDRRAELARERPVGTFVLHQDTAVDPRTGGALGELLQLLGAVEGEQRHAPAERSADRGRLLDGVAEADGVGSCPSVEAAGHLLIARGIKAGAQAYEAFEDG